MVAVAAGWDTEPFDLIEKDGKLYGRGATDDKGPALSWLWVIEVEMTCVASGVPPFTTKM